MIYSAFSLIEHLEYSAVIQKQRRVLLIQHITAEYIVSEYLHILYTPRDYPECATNVCKYICCCWHNSQAQNECGYNKALWLLHQLLLIF